MRNRQRNFSIFVVLLLNATAISGAFAQLRIVDYNTAGIQNNTAMQTVLAAIAAESVNGVVKPIDVMILQELSSGDINTMVSNLNSLGMGTYIASSVGSTTGAGGVGLVYRDESVDLIQQQQVVNTSGSGAARGVMRFTLRPAGYDSAANFYIYNSHYKSSDNGTDAARRNVEAAAIRANSDALGQGAHVIYAGDFNIYRSSEPMWATLTGAGNGQAFDPVNQVGTWHDGSSFRAVHTQNPAGSGGVGGGMDDRFDWQMITGELQDNEGMSIISGSYHAFANNNTHTMNGHINTGTGATLTVLNALGDASDHLPVVAQYQVPAKMAVAVSSVPTNVLVGASVNATVNVSNSAGDNQSVSKVVMTAIGADELDYTVTGSGAASGSLNGTDAALGGSNNHDFSLSTATAGAKVATFTTNATSPQVPNPSNIVNRNYNVLDHATPSFDSASESASLMYDFGAIALGDPTPMFSFDVFNRLATTDFTASMDFDSVTASGDTSALTTNAAALAGSLVLSAGAGQSFTASMATAAIGVFEATYTLNFSDENLAGALNKSIVLTLSGEVFSPTLDGDYNGDGTVDAADYVVWRKSPSSYGNAAGYETWKANFGAVQSGVGGGLGTNSTPEPASATLWMIASVFIYHVARTRSRNH